MVSHLFLNIFFVFAMMIPGYIAIRRKWINPDSIRDLSKLVINVIYPALIFGSILKNFSIKSLLNLWELPLSVFLITITGFVVGVLLAFISLRKRGIESGSIIYQCTFNNYSFLPLAIIALLYNSEHMAALILSTIGAEVTVWTLGVSILNKKTSIFSKQNIRHFFSAPLVSIYLSFFILVVMNLFHINLKEARETNEWLKYLLHSIEVMGTGTIPMTMLVAGSRMASIKLTDMKDFRVWLITLFRLLIIPALAIGMLFLFFRNHQYFNIMLIVAVMPVSINSILLTEIYGGDQKLISGSVLVSHAISLITIPLWLALLL